MFIVARSASNTLGLQRWFMYIHVFVILGNQDSLFETHSLNEPLIKFYIFQINWLIRYKKKKHVSKLLHLINAIIVLVKHKINAPSFIANKSSWITRDVMLSEFRREWCFMKYYFHSSGILNKWSLMTYFCLILFQKQSENHEYFNTECGRKLGPYL